MKDLSQQLNDSHALIESMMSQENILKNERDSLLRKYGHIIDIEAEKEKIKEEYRLFKKDCQDQIDKLKYEFKVLDDNYKLSLNVFTDLKKEIELYESKSELLNYGLYEPIYNYNSTERYKEEIKAAIEEQKRLINDDNAIIYTINWTLNGSEAQGRRLQKRSSQLLLRAFNGECDAFIAKVRWNNVIVCNERIKSSFTRLNKLQEANGLKISEKYLELKIKELNLEYEYDLKKHQEKEKEREIREEQREEEKALREIERERQKAEKEEQYYLKALNKVQKEIETATGVRYEQLMDKIHYLEDELKEVQENKERAISMAQQTRRGYVYIISNIGSFGENIYKIGMTRRLDPVDRIRELSNASVPFRYDIHAMIFAEDAPTLESMLHNIFDNKKVNAINGRKEFFNVSIDDIEKAVLENGFQVEFIKHPEARDYRETVMIRDTYIKVNSTDQQVEELMKYPNSLFNYEEYLETDD